MFDFLFFWKKKKGPGINRQRSSQKIIQALKCRLYPQAILLTPVANDTTAIDRRCANGNHEFNDAPVENWQAIGAVVIDQKRFVQCQRLGCGYKTTQIRKRVCFDINAPFGEWKDRDQRYQGLDLD